MELARITGFDMLADITFEGLAPDEEPLTESEQLKWLSELDGWEIKKAGHYYLFKTFSFANFQQALTFVNQIGALAEEVDHHPELTLSWGRVEVSWWTHSLHGLHLNDFVLAHLTANCYEARF